MLWFFLILAICILGAPFIFIFAFTRESDVLPPMDRKDIDKYYDPPRQNKK